MKSKEFARRLLEWDAGIERNMPWENEKDPYLIWLSEILLQQTRVEQGLPYFLKFKVAYPTVHDLANADDDEVFKLWQGLGYYNRCRNLLYSARVISNEYDGIFPKTYEEILGLKGVGPYTAAAIASFAYDLPHAVVDGNVKRVMSRYYGIHDPIDESSGLKVIEAKGAALIKTTSPSRFNQAIMNFGAVQCVPRNPNCLDCPFRRSCYAFKNDLVDVLPIKKKKTKKRKRYFIYMDIRQDGQRLVAKREGKDIWQNLYELPLVEIEQTFDQAKGPFTNSSFKGLKIDTERIIHAQIYRQTLSHQYIHAVFIKPQLKKSFGILDTRYLWVSEDQFEKLAFPKIIVDYLQENDGQTSLSF